MSSRNMPQCEVCFIEENSKWEPESVGDDGSLVSKLVAIAVPDDLETGLVNICATCGDITIVGIYSEIDEDDIKFDREPLNTTRYDF